MSRATALLTIEAAQVLSYWDPANLHKPKYPIVTCTQPGDSAPISKVRCELTVRGANREQRFIAVATVSMYVVGDRDLSTTWRELGGVSAINGMSARVAARDSALASEGSCLVDGTTTLYRGEWVQLGLGARSLRSMPRAGVAVEPEASAPAWNAPSESFQDSLGANPQVALADGTATALAASVLESDSLRRCLGGALLALGEADLSPFAPANATLNQLPRILQSCSAWKLRLTVFDFVKVVAADPGNPRATLMDEMLLCVQEGERYIVQVRLLSGIESHVVALAGRSVIDPSDGVARSFDAQSLLDLGVEAFVSALMLGAPTTRKKRRRSQ